jgi:general secretion pathway protein G
MIRRTRINRLRHAFTLMEVLLVLIILVVLAGLVIRNFMPTLESAKKSSAKIMISSLSSSLKQYQLQLGTLPTSLDALHQQPADADASTWVQMLEKPVAMDPWGKPYEYKLNGSTFELRSVGPDGQSGTADDITS